MARPGALANTSDADPALTIVIPTFNGLHHLRRCLLSTTAECTRLETTPEILIIDNGSTDGTAEYVRATYPTVQILPLGTNKGFAEACDRGIRAARGKYCLFLNNDAWFAERALEALLHFAQEGNYAIAGPMILNPDGSLQWGPQVIDILGDPTPAAPGQRTFLLVGVALLVRCRDYFELGGFDGRFFAFYEESDLQWRAQLAGRSVGYAPQSRVYHLGGGTLGGAIVRPDRATEIQWDRLYLARRNQLAALLRNLSIRSLSWTLPLWFASAAMECVGAGALGHTALPRVYLTALVWNVRQLRPTLRQRQGTQALRIVSDRDLRRHFAPPFARLRTLIALARQHTHIEIASRR